MSWEEQLIKEQRNLKTMKDIKSGHHNDNFRK
jgi:hypothetical protein